MKEACQTAPEPIKESVSSERPSYFIHTEVRQGVQVQPAQTLQDGVYVVIVQDAKRTRQKMLAIRD